MKTCVAGFMFCELKETVALVLKNKGPQCIIGKYNAIGGKVDEKDQSLHDTMVREFHEETGVKTQRHMWRTFCRLYGPDYQVYFFVALSEAVFYVKTMEKEQIENHLVETLRMDLCVPNLRWLIPMALDMNYVYAEVYDKTLNA